MKRLFKRWVEFIAHIKIFFKPYDEELMDGLDVEELLKDPNKEIKIRALMEANHDNIETVSETYTMFMNEYVVVDRIDNLSKDLSINIQNLCRRFSETQVLKEETEKRSLEAKKKEHPSMNTYKLEIPKAIEILKEHEEQQQKVKSDLNILEGEKESLLYQFRNLRRALNFLRFFLIMLVGSALIAGIVLSTLLSVYNKNVFLPSLVTVIAISFLFLWTYIFRRYCVHELKKNQMLQERAMKLINKTKIKYVRNQQLLDFEYSKYKVNSSEVLVLRYENYLEAKQESRNYEQANNSMKSIVIELDQQLSRLHIESIDFILRNADYFSTHKGIKSLKARYVSEREDLQKELKKLEHEKSVLSNLLTK